MADQPTILIGSLNDKELTESINALVNNVNKATQDMTRSFDTAIDAMKKKLQELGTQKIDFGGSTDGGSKRRTSMQEKEKSAVTDVTMSYDKLVGALQMAQRAFKVLENRKTFSADDVREYYERLNRVKEIQEKLNIATGQMYLQRAEQASLPFNGKAIVEQIALQEKGSTEIRKMNDYYRELEKGAQSVIQPTREYSQEIQRLAQQIKQSTQFQEQGYTTVGKAVVYKREELSVEEQLYQAQQKYGDEVLKTTDGIESERTSMRQFGGEAKDVADNLVNVHEQTVKSRQIMAQQAKGGLIQSYDELQQTIMRVLNVTAEEVQTVNTKDASYVALSNELKQLTAAYGELTAAERSGEDGQRLAKNIQIVSRELQKISQQKMRPTSLQEVMGLDEKTLDDMAYKVKQLQLYRSGLNTSTAQGTQEIKQVNKAIAELTQRQQKYMASVNKSTTANNALTRSFNYMKNRLAFMFTVGGTIQFAKQLAEVRGEYEMTERALGVLVSSAERGTKIFNELSQMALVSPYTLIELSNAAKQLVAYDVAARDVVDTTRRLADISAAVGAPVERLTYALGQIKAYEYLNSRDARIFANAGIPLVKQLSQYYSELEGRLVSVGDVYDRIKKKAVSYNDVMGVLIRMTDEGGRFFDYQTKVADTLKVQLANLTLAWNNMLNQIGKEQGGMLSGAIGMLKDIFKSWKDINEALKVFIWTFGIYKGLQLLVITFQEEIISERIKEIFITDKLAASYGRLSTSMKGLATSGASWITIAIAMLTSIAIHLKKVREETLAFNKAISDGAREASKSLKEFLDNAENVTIQVRALNDQLTPEEGEKAWEIIRDELENSAAASNTLIPELLKIEDINERVSAAFDMAGRVRDAQNALSSLFDEFKVHDMWRPKWLGIFGDRGFEQDLTRWDKVIKLDKEINEIEDERQRLYEKETRMVYKRFERFTNKEREKQLSETNEKWRKRQAILDMNWSEEQGLRMKRAWLDNYDFRGPFVGDEAIKEIETLAENASKIIKRKLGEGVNDSIQVSEAIQRFYTTLYEKYPNFSKEMRENIEWYSSQTFAEQFDVFNLNATAEKKFFDSLEKKAKATFMNISDDIRDSEGLWYNEAQEKAIQSTLKELPKKWAELLTKALGEDINSQEWRMSVLAHFDIENRDAIQRTFDKIFHDEMENVSQRGYFVPIRRKTGESDLEWEKRLADEEKDLNAQIKQSNYMLEQQTDKENDVYKARKKDLEQEQARLDAIKRVQRAFNLRSHEQLEADKKLGKGEDEISQAIKKEIQLVSDVQKKYKEYRKLGLDATTSLNLAGQEYNNTLNQINTTLRKFGLTTLSNKDLTEKTQTEIRDFYQKQLEQIKKTSATAKQASVLTYDATAGEKSEIEGISNALIEATKHFEAFRALAYDDKTGKTVGVNDVVEGTLTQGYGHSELAPTIKENPIIKGLSITPEEAHKWMIDDYRVLKSQLDGVISQLVDDSPEIFEPLKKMTASQYEALLDFTYQYGAGNAKGSLTKGVAQILRASQGDLQKLAEYIYDPQKASEALGYTGKWIMDSTQAQMERRTWRRDMITGEKTTVDAVIREVQALIKQGKEVEAIELLEKAITDLNIAIAKTDFEDKMNAFKTAFETLKDSYDIAKEMKDTPELAGIFADMLGLSDAEIENLPQTADDMIDQLQYLVQESLNQLLGDGFQTTVDLRFLLNQSNLDTWLKEQGISTDSGVTEMLKSVTKYANEQRKKEVADQVADWNKLLEKYAEYEYKRTEIIKQAEREREAARKNGATQDIFNAIDKGERRQLASLDFEQFQKSNLWLTATGDLATLTDGALRGLIDALDEYKNKAQDLDPKEIKNINSALRKMHKELRRGNPFTAIAEAIDDAKERAADFQDEINETEIKMTELWQKISSGQGTKEDMAMLDTLADKLAYLKKVATEAGKVSPTAFVSGINDAIAVARTATNEFKELANALGGKGMTDAAENLEHTMNIIESAGQGAAIGAQFSGWGALIGAVAGGLKGVIVEFADEWSGNKGITEQIKESNRELTRMGQLLDDVSWHANKTYGVMKSGMQGVQAQVKKWQMVELERQLALEQSRKAKNKDEDEIMRLQGEIASLRREIDDLYDSSVNTMLGISDWGGQIETMVGAMIDAFRNGEDAMVAFSEKWDEMIDNIILKLLVSQYVQRAWDEIQKTLEEMEADITSTAKEAVAQSKDENRMMSEWLVEKGYAQWIGETGRTAITATEEELERIQEEWINERKAYLAKRQQQAEDQLKNAEEKYYEKSIDYLMGEGKQSVEAVLDPLYEKIKDLYDYGDKGNKQLSLLQQGIQGITEETAGALEAMLNGISQQIYLHTDIMLRIEQSIQDLDLSVGAAVNSQILLQLQSSYQTQEAIRSTLEGWSSPSGLSVRVQMVE